MATSVDGKSTQGNKPPREWSSKEDKQYLHKLINNQHLVVMGRKTYQAAKSIIQLKPQILRIVLTKSPQRFSLETVSGQLEFTNESPSQLVKRLQKQNYRQMLLLGGSSLNTAFFKNKLIDELWLTLEPKIFGQGLGLMDQGVDINLKLKSIKKLNKQGTLFLKYEVIN